MNSINNPKHPVILFIPEAGIYPFVRGLSVLGDAVQRAGGKVLITRDSGQMIRSPIMAMHRLPVDASMKSKSFIYKTTDRYLKKVKENYNFNFIELSDMINDKLLLEIDRLINKPKQDLRNIKFRGFEVGRIAEYDFILETKFPYSKNLSKKHRELYATYVKNTALSLLLVDEISKRYKPSLFITFNEYAQNQAVRYGAQINNVRRMALTYPVHLNIDASRFSMWDSTYESWRYNHCQNWIHARGVPIFKDNVIDCWKDSLFRMYEDGSHIFSSPKNNDPLHVFRSLKLDPTRKTIIVYTSSGDERMSVETAVKIWKEKSNIKDAFKSQIEWLKFLRRYAKNTSNIQIIVRIHPREGSFRQGDESNHLSLLKSQFNIDLENFKIVWPNDPISSYDLMELADVSLVAWSVMGQETARLGIPTLTYTGNMHYPNDDFIKIATTKVEYLKSLNEVVLESCNLDKLTRAVRFFHWRTFIPSLNLSETVSPDFGDNNVWPKAPKSKISVINDILSDKTDLIEYNIKKWVKSLPKNAISQESQAMKEGIRYFLDKVYYPPKRIGKVLTITNILFHKITGKSIDWFYFQKSFVDYRLVVSEDGTKIKYFTNQTRKDRKLRVILVDGHYANLIHKGRVTKRFSPMVVRLAKLYSSDDK